jgi:hypothetical protein
MIIAKIETFPLRLPFKSNTRAAASAWGDKDLPVDRNVLREYLRVETNTRAQKPA